ncbi:carbohydrate ABC transporter permease [Microtetraspora sp. NBRC 16547]|uniref:carbohydrate ABC transporter permease n=1 Tax=Microtetraspora sp. NBRC 16547 TaxID=3030993 RepID=UPI0024A482F8|nr:carbohydrate ABC transporter permease [Microtetraspora sp. NBRC 16547]GLX02332.1 sugar ABC transporter permease [Microtetraspora sp. NBRC 16547]
MATVMPKPAIPGAGHAGGAVPAGRPARRLWLRPFDMFCHAFLLVWAVLVVFPLLWAVLSSVKTDGEIFTDPWGLPVTVRFDNWARAWTEASIGRYFMNSLIVVGGALALTMLLGSMTAYCLARYEFRGNRLIYYLFVGGMTFPVFLALVPLFFVVEQLGMLGTYHGLIVVYTAYALPFTVFFLTGFFRTLPGEVAEAAFVDGCSHAGVFFRVMLPMARPGLISVGIFNFLGLWNQYLLPLVLNPDEDHYVLAQGLAALAVSQGYRSDWSGLFAGLVIGMLPVLIVYAVFQRRIQAGMTAGAIR